MQSILNEYKLILSSGSPRRKELLEQSGLVPFDIRVREIDESFDDNMDVMMVASYLASKKAAVFSHITNDELYITADTVVILDNKIYGKPVNRQDAINTLQALSNKEHQVVTGVCLRTANKTKVFDDLSVVKILPMTLEEIEYYVDTYQPYDKAGSYGIQDWLGICKVEYIRGSYTNIMGMPMQKVYHEIQLICG